MTDTYTEDLHRLKIEEHGAMGGLKGVVIGLLIRHDIGLDIEPKDWERLRHALEGSEAAHKAVVDHLCKPGILV